MTTTVSKKVEQTARLRWVPLDQIKVNDPGQREKINTSHVAKIVANLDLDQIGNPIVSHRDGSYWVIDGMHRIAALRDFGFTNEAIQCWAYEGLTSAQEAEMFLKRNNTLPISAFDRFTIAVHSGRPVEVDIDRIVRSVGCVVTRAPLPGGVSAVAALRSVYGRGPGVLARTLCIVRDAYGDGGYEAIVINGIGLLCARYNGDLNDDDAVRKLAKEGRGSKGLIQKADVLRRQTGTQKTQCVAAAAVEIVNAGRGGKKLPSWWKDAS